MKKRCAWVNPENELYARYHDDEWGVPVHDDRTLFEMLILEGAQAGLSWETILKKRDNYRAAFHNFDIAACARLTEADEARFMENPGIVRNRLKIRSVSINARAVLAIQKEYGSLNAFLWAFVDHKPLDPRYQAIGEIPTKDDLSDRISKDLKRRGMKFIGSTIVFAYLQAVGIVNAHTTDCFRHRELRARG
ncbi:MAG TPA: DNA-3-methyladenine glycosylase I [Treponemataceae bacterium]|nr:DNA-3-methyladenine glycosylase I [Treponemataceae bacterium]